MCSPPQPIYTYQLPCPTPQEMRGRGLKGSSAGSETWVQKPDSPRHLQQSPSLQLQCGNVPGTMQKWTLTDFKKVLWQWLIDRMGNRTVGRNTALGLVSNATCYHRHLPQTKPPKTTPSIRQPLHTLDGLFLKKYPPNTHDPVVASRTTSESQWFDTLLSQKTNILEDS